jgi:hypothetical protein
VRPMRRAIVGGLIGILATCGAVSPASGATPAGCAPPRARVLARSAAVRVYETRPPAGEPRAVIACLAGHRGHMTLLAATRLNLHTSLARFELAGHVAAYLETQLGVDSASTKLVAVDVGTRRVLHAIEAGSYIDGGLIFDEAVIRFLVTSGGSIAWSVTREDHRETVVESVWAAPREGAPALLDSGPAIDAGSLSLAGTTLSWTDAGSERTAPMP